MLIPTTVLTNPLSSAGGATDAIADMFGTPDTAFEFDTSSLTGLTAVGSSPDVEAAHTIFPGHYYVERRTNSGGFMGRYLAVPSIPWTAIVKVTGANQFTDFNKAIMFIAANSGGSPSTSDVFSYGRTARNFAIDRWSNPTTFSAGVTSDMGDWTPPFYMAIKAVSSTDYDFLVSKDGYVWVPFWRTRNPSLTIAWLGFGVTCENASTESAAAFDFLRIWNSAKTFLGAA